MKNCLLLLIACFSLMAHAQTSDFRYVSPKPNSVLVACRTNIILQCAWRVDPSSLTDDLLRVEGSRTGPHAGALILSDDGRTIVFNPVVPFGGSETVTVAVRSGIRTRQGNVLPDWSYRFATMPHAAQASMSSPGGGLIEQPGANAAPLPVPPIKIDSVNDPAPGYIFLATWDRNTPVHKYANYLFILDRNGKIVDSMRVNGAPFDFQIQPNGQLSFGLGDYSGITPGNSNLKQYVMDSTLAIVDSFQMKNGYLTDFHDFILLPNGHAMLMSYHTVTYDMSLVTPGGKPDALVVINVFQEQDADKNVVFEWRDIDYLPITDTDLRLTDPRINPSTMNAFDLDHDGNLLFSFRNHSDIMKVSRETGEVIWRWGGLKNQFTFINDHPANAPYFFARQHDVHRLANGNISLFDNGEFHVPWYSRGAEYRVDERNMTATLVSEYRYPSGNIIAQAAGNAQRLANDGWFVGFGILDPTSPVMRNIVESHADGTTAFELSLPANVISYRVSKQPWRELIKNTLVSNAEVLKGNTYSFDKNGKTTGVSITFVDIEGDTYNNVVVNRIPHGPVRPEFIGNAPVVSPVSILYSGAAITSHTSELHFALQTFPEIIHPSRTSVYQREFAGQGLFLELPTTYDSTAKELTATTTKFGEIIFGAPDGRFGQAVPRPFEPTAGKRVPVNQPVTLKWAGQGLLKSFRLQLAVDTLFQTVVLDTMTNNSFLQRAFGTAGQKVYWRVRAYTGTGFTDWSDIWSFEPTNMFLSLLAPNGGERLSIGKPVVIRWDTNISDSVRVSLLQGQIQVAVLGKTFAGNNAFLWNVAANSAQDSNYRVAVIPYLDSIYADTSSAWFSLTSVVGIEPHGQGQPEGFALFPNYPNPFNPSTIISYAIPFPCLIRLEVINGLGQVVGRLVDGREEAGTKSVRWNPLVPSGLYFYRLVAVSTLHPDKRFIETRKMVLLH